MLVDELITEVIRSLKVVKPTGNGQQLTREAMHWEALRAGIPVDMVARAWKVGLSVDEAISRVMARQA